MKQFRIPKTENREQIMARIYEYMMNSLSDKYEWSVKITQFRKQRSTEQNSLYWKWIGTIAEETGHKPNEIHEYLKEEYMPKQVVKVMGNEREVTGSTTKLTTAEMSGYMSAVSAFAAEWGILLPDPTLEGYQ